MTNDHDINFSIISTETETAKDCCLNDFNTKMEQVWIDPSSLNNQHRYICSLQHAKYILQHEDKKITPKVSYKTTDLAIMYILMGKKTAKEPENFYNSGLMVR